MYSAFRSWAERLLRIPADPEPPPGDEHSAQLFRAAPNFYRYLLVVWALKTVAVVAAAMPALILPFLITAAAAHKHHHAPPTVLLGLPVPILAIFVLWRILALALVRLDFEKRWYVVTDRSLRVREGVVGVREMTVTFANIQNISVSQGPIQRAIGIADLRVDTAGGGTSQQSKGAGENLHTAFFRGVANASEIRELIQRRLRQVKDAGLGDREDRSASVPLPDEPSFSDNTIIAVLREVRDEAMALRRTAEARA